MAYNCPPPIDQGEDRYKPKSVPLQFKRGTSRAFKKVNPILLCGEPAYEYDTKKLKVGDGFTRYNHLPYIGDHSKAKDGKSAYQIWLDAGNTGTINDFLDSLVGEQGKSTYEIWLSLGHEGTVVDFIEAITGKPGEKGDKGDPGLSAYEVWLQQGHTGTEDDYLDWLRSTSWGEF
jgi:hypothetical protein